MRMYMITIDSGTTNSRIRLVREKDTKVLDVIKKPVGVRDTAITGNSDSLKTRLSQGLQELIFRNGLEKEQIQYIVAAGMITSDLGLYKVDHIEAPSKIEDFARSSAVQRFDLFFNIPCIFIPGMKNRAGAFKGIQAEEISELDVMRGEEVETFGLLKQLGLTGKGTILLPGSHTKFVFVNNGEIESCYTTLGGEAIHSISRGTILSDSLSKNLVASIEPEHLLAGYQSSKKHGLTRALFQVRLLHLYDIMNENQRSNYLVGAVIASDMAEHMIRRLKEQEWVVIGGGNPLRKAFAEVFSYLGFSHMIEAADEQADLSTVIGSRAIGNLVSLTKG